MRMFLIAALILFTAYIHITADPVFQCDSEDLVVGPLYAIKEGVDLDMGSYGLGRLSFGDRTGVVYINVTQNGASFSEPYSYKVYDSQIGIQGMIFMGITKIVSPFMSFKMIYHGFRLCCLLLFVGVIFLIAWQLKERYGSLLAVVFGSVAFLSPWTVNFAANLYWLEFTWFLPLFLGLFILNHPDKEVLTYVLFYVSVLFKCMCGYEYLSTILMSGILFLLLEWMLHKEERKRLLKTVFIIGVLSVLAFLTSYLIHAYIYGSGSIGEGLKLMKVNLVERRTYGDASNYDPAYAESMKASAFDVLRKYIGLDDQHSKKILFLFLSAIAALVIEFVDKDKNRTFDLWAFVISFLAPVSWLVLAKSHSYIHTHISFVLFYVGWAQIAVYIIIKTVAQKIGLDLREVVS